MTNKEAETIMENLIYLYRPIGDSLEAWGMAIKALNRQVPKKPIDNTEREWFECPTCGRVIVTYHAGERHHCKCGQALGWSEERGE